MQAGRENNRALGDLKPGRLVLTELFFPSKRRIGSPREASSGRETQLVDCASSIFHHESPAWQKVSACWAPTQGLPP